MCFVPHFLWLGTRRPPEKDVRVQKLASAQASITPNFIAHAWPTTSTNSPTWSRALPQIYAHRAASTWTYCETRRDRRPMKTKRPPKSLGSSRRAHGPENLGKVQVKIKHAPFPRKEPEKRLARALAPGFAEMTQEHSTLDNVHPPESRGPRIFGTVEVKIYRFIDAPGNRVQQPIRSGQRPVGKAASINNALVHPMWPRTIQKAASTRHTVNQASRAYILPLETKSGDCSGDSPKSAN